MTAERERLVEYLRKARRILIFTGAGISTGSGIPDFRGPNGVWTRRQPVYYQDFMASEAARIEHWEYKLEAWPAFCAARPNPVHHAIVKLEKADKIIAVLTQNIDGLHALAGSDRQHLIELHGTNLLVECQTCLWRGDPEPFFEAFRTHRRPPLCTCGGYLKPATISFGQSLDPLVLERAGAAAQGTDLVISLGSTLSVHPAASFPLLAATRGIPYVIINRGATDQDGQPCVSLRLEGEVTAIFPVAVDAALA
ncbi:MAG: NAD-dependent deacetylase [Verrucomicrobiota bacterium]|jgi:NAD-dependent deacetylase|nr:NAD-dependent deacetylase [Verrucomicrobiota bacterium]MEA3205866.1 NAD-dependent deacetylase [Verrucomicrobiota bacterium]